MPSMNEDFLFLQQSVSAIVANSFNPKRSYSISKQVIMDADQEAEKWYRVTIPGVGSFENEMITNVLIGLMDALQREKEIEERCKKEAKQFQESLYKIN